MARVFITGSADGLGLLAARLLVEQGHDVVVHGRSAERAAEAQRLAGAGAAVQGDLSSMEETQALAEQVNRLGRMDAVIHNAGVGYREGGRGDTAEGLPLVFAVNTMATYLLTALIERPKRLVYMSSGMHYSARPNFDDLTWERRGWNGSQAYAETKLHDALLAFAVARLWPDVPSNAVDPGWVPTKMGGRGAPDDLELGYRTQAWLAVSEDAEAQRTGRYMRHQQEREPNAAVRDVAAQDRLLKALEDISGVPLPT